MITATDKANINLILAAEKTVSSPESASMNSNTTVNSSQPSSTPHPANELSRENVMSLVSNRREAITVSFARSQHETFGNQYYERLMNDKVISCKKTYPLKWGSQVDTSVYLYTDCTPGPNGRELTIDGSALEVVIGYKVPSQITGISKVDATTASADVTMIFQRTAGFSVYEKYQIIFNPYGTLRLNTQNESRRVLLRLYDDGWRVEQFN